MLFIPFALFLACGDKTEDTAKIQRPTLNQKNPIHLLPIQGVLRLQIPILVTPVILPNPIPIAMRVTPNVGAWTVYGPEFTTNTCGGGEEFPDPRR